MNRTALLGLDLVVLVSSYTHSEKPQIALTPQITNLTLTSIFGNDLTHDDLICSFDLSGDAAIPSNATISIGSFGASNGYMWQGTIDGVRLYNRALSREQIASAYTNGPNVVTYTETSPGDVWQACVAPFSANAAGVTTCSDTPVIQEGAKAPIIITTPVTTATVGVIHVYDVDATGSPAPMYTLTTSPAGMTINATTGLIQWTPSATGSVPVTVEAYNSAGSDTQNFTILVGEAPVVDNVVLTSTVGFYSTTDDLFCEYDLGGSAVTAATSWYVSGSPLTPLAALYMPFEGGAVEALNDYSGEGITATPRGDPTWISTGSTMDSARTSSTGMTISAPGKTSRRTRPT